MAETLNNTHMTINQFVSSVMAELADFLEDGQEVKFELPIHLGAGVDKKSMRHYLALSPDTSNSSNSKVVFSTIYKSSATYQSSDGMQVC